MRLHTKLDFHSIYNAAKVAGVQLEEASRHGSRTADHAFEVHLSGNSRRRPNRSFEPDEYAATWDQWGVFLGFLYQLDPDMVCGVAKHPTYSDADTFNYRTNGRFDLDYSDPIPFPLNHDHVFRFEGVPYQQTCKRCGAVTCWDY